jgi:hypothetical protein
VSSTPAEDPRLLPGRSALEWSQFDVVVYLVLATTMVLEWVYALFHVHSRGWMSAVIIATHCLLAASTLAAVTLFWLVRSRRARERLAGYTTAIALDQDLDLLDYKTGAVLRPAGAPVFRSRREFRAARLRVAELGSRNV